MVQQTETLIATVVCPQCGKAYSLLDTPEFKVGEQPRRYPGTDPITFLCCDVQTVQPEKVEYRPTGRPLIDKDHYRFQRARIERIAHDMAPHAKVEFDEAATWLKFRIRDEATRANLTEPSGEWEPSVLADKPEEWLRSYIRRLSNGKI
jgi:hypothetical protein